MKSSTRIRWARLAGRADVGRADDRGDPGEGRRQPGRVVRPDDPPAAGQVDRLDHDRERRGGHLVRVGVGGPGPEAGRRAGPARASSSRVRALSRLASTASSRLWASPSVSAAAAATRVEPSSTGTTASSGRPRSSSTIARRPPSTSSRATATVPPAAASAIGDGSWVPTITSTSSARAASTKSVAR